MPLDCQDVAGPCIADRDVFVGAVAAACVVESVAVVAFVALDLVGGVDVLVGADIEPPPGLAGLQLSARKCLGVAD